MYMLQDFVENNETGRNVQLSITASVGLAENNETGLKDVQMYTRGTAVDMHRGAQRLGNSSPQ